MGLDWPAIPASWAGIIVPPTQDPMVAMPPMEAARQRKRPRSSWTPPNEPITVPDETPPKDLSQELGHVLEAAVEAAVDAAVDAAETQLAEATTAIPLVSRKNAENN